MVDAIAESCPKGVELLLKGLPKASRQQYLERPLAPPLGVSMVSAARVQEIGRATIKAVTDANETVAPESGSTSPGATPPRRLLARAQSRAVLAEREEGDHSAPAVARGEKPDVWGCPQLLTFIQEGAEGLDGTDEERIMELRKRSAPYSWEKDRQRLRRLIPGSGLLEVPPPAKREELIRAEHAQAGHAGMAKTVCMLRMRYWWFGLTSDVRRVLRTCEACARVRAARGGSQTPQLRHPPIKDVGYRWGCDWAGGFTSGEAKHTGSDTFGHKHLFICIEYTSKWVEVWPAREKMAEVSAYLFQMLVVSRFGAPAEVITDGGPEFQGEFRDYLNCTHSNKRAIHRGLRRLSIMIAPPTNCHAVVSKRN